MRVFASRAFAARLVADAVVRLPVAVGGTAHADRAFVASASFVLGFVEKRFVTTRAGALPESELFVPLPPIAVLASLVGRFLPAVAEWSLASAPLDAIASARSATDTRLEVGARARRQLQGRRST